MNLRKTVFSFASVVLGTALWAGCSGGGDDASDGNDQAATAGCKVTNEQTGKAMTADDLSKLGDPIAKRVLLGGCPQKLDGIIDSLS